MTNEEIEELARDSASMSLSVSTKNWTPVMYLATRLVQLLDERSPKPRVWRGEDVDVSHWMWETKLESWRGYDTDLDDGDIFVPGTAPKPTEPPGPVETLAECDKVDW